MGKIYTLQSPSGKTLKIEADSPEKALEGAGAWELQNSPLGRQESPGFWSGEQAARDIEGIAERAGRGAVSAVPGAQSFQAFSDPNSSGFQKLGAVSGDMLSGGLAVLSGGASIPAMAKANAFIEGSGLGPKSRELGGKLMDAFEPKTQSVPLNMLLRTPQTLASLGVEMLPSILAGKAGIGAIPERGPQAPQGPTPSAPHLPEMMQDGPDIAPSSPFVPSPMKINPDISGRIQGIEKGFLGGRKLTLGQKQEMQAPRAESAAKDFEFRTSRSGAAIDDANFKLQAIHNELGKMAEAQAPGVKNIRPNLAGKAIGDNYSKLIDDAGSSIEQAEMALKDLPTFKTLKADLRSPIVKALNEVAGEYKLTGNKVSSVPKSERAFFQDVVNEAKKIGNIDDLITFRRWLRNEISSAQDNLKIGRGDFIDRMEQRLYESVDTGISRIRQFSPQERMTVDNFLNASANYKKVKFSPEAQTVKDLIGYKGKGLPLDKTGEDISRAMFSGGRNLGEKLNRAQAQGLVNSNHLKQAAWSQFLDEVTKDGRLDRAALRRTINSLDDTDKAFLFGKDASRVAKAADIADLVTYAERYMPMTGAALPKLAPTAFRALEGLPGGKMMQGVASRAYYASPRAQSIIGADMPTPKMPSLPKIPSFDLPPTSFSPRQQAMLQTLSIMQGARDKRGKRE